MKKLLLLLLFIPLVSLGQVSESYHPNGTIKSRQVIASETGVLIQYYENGNIQSKFQFYAKNTFSNGEVFGIKGDFIYDKIQKTYFEEGGVSTEVIVKKSFNSSKKDYSETKKFNTNGSLIEEGIYREGQKDGYFKFYRNDGVLESEGNYYKGERNGIYKTYYEDGISLDIEARFKNGIGVGMSRKYYKNGQIATLEDTSSKELKQCWNSDGQKIECENLIFTSKDKNLITSFSQLDKRIIILEFSDDLKALQKQLSNEDLNLIVRTFGELLKINQTQDPTLLKAYKDITSLPGISWYDEENKILDLTFRNVLSIGNIKIESQRLKFKDGKELYYGDILNSCLKSFSKVYDNDLENICNCQLEQLAKKFTSTEILSLFEEAIMLNGMFEYKSPTLGIAQKLAGNKKFYNAVIPCFTSNADILEQTLISSQGVRITDEQIIAAAELHLDDLKKDDIEVYNEISKSVNMKNYSECYIKTMFNEFGYSELFGDNPEVTSRLEQIQQECFKNNKKL